MSRYASDDLSDDLIFILGLDVSEIYKAKDLCGGNISYAAQGAVVFFQEVIKAFLMEAGPYLPDNRDWFFDDWGTKVSKDFTSNYFKASCNDSEFFKKESLLLLLDTNFIELVVGADFKSREDRDGFKRAWVITHQLFNIGD